MKAKEGGAGVGYCGGKGAESGGVRPALVRPIGKGSGGTQRCWDQGASRCLVAGDGGFNAS